MITYYLRHRGPVEQYLAGRATAAAQVRIANQGRFAPGGIRDRLIARLPD